jgi:hypothetical protein
MRSADLKLLFILLFLTAATRPASAVTAEMVMQVTSAASGDWYGYSVAGDFDFNGDGYADLAVAAPFNDTGGILAGRVYIYLRGPGSDEVADVTITGPGVDDNLGWSLARAGDVNNDGFDDLIVGALDCCGNLGFAQIHLGAATPNGVADLTMTGAANDDLFGYSVAGAGDVNGDGFDDWIVGAPQNDTGGSNAGRAYVYFGGAALNNAADVIVTGAAASDQFGGGVSGAGDVNGDGFDDFLAGAFAHDSGGSSAGRVYLYLGGSSVDNVADLVHDGFEASNYGRPVAHAGDMNGDGFADFAVSAFVDPTGGASAGRVHVFFGGAIPNAVPDLTFVGGTADSLGFSLAGGGDVDGDGYDDLIVGVPGGGSGGEVQVFLGGPVTDAKADLVISGEAAYDRFGTSVSFCGDANGDGHPDLLVGAIYAGSGGEAYVYALSGYGLVTPNGGEQWVSGRPATIRWSGRELTDVAVSPDAGATWITLAEDVGGSVENTIALIAPSPATDQALVRIRMAGQALSPSTSDVSDATFRIVDPHTAPAAALSLQATLLGATTGDLFGGSVAAAGDVNGDGFGDFIVGANGNDAGGASAGRAYVYFGGPSFDGVADVIFTGATSSDNLGGTVCGAGDVNGDGYDDVLVSATGNDAAFSNAGAVYVYFGGPAMDNVADWTLSGAAASDGFGSDAAGAGDVNGDGYDDVVVGATGNDTGGTSAGAAYVFYGGPAPDAVADLTLYGGASADVLGTSVDGAGDVNGDGYADVVVGSIGSDAGGSNAGRVYVHFGGPSLDTLADLVLTGESGGDNFGMEVAGVGDFDGDGFDDILVGAHLNDASGTSSGSAYLYLGGPVADDTPDLVLRGLVASENFGFSVGAAGDVNGDGFSDLTVGAYNNDQAFSDAGRAVLVLGGPGADASPDGTFRGGAASWFLGYSVSGAGDVNGDGFDDLIFGARQSAAAGTGMATVYDGHRFFITSPSGGDTWNVGATETISWLGGEPADVWLSVDGGNSYTLLEESAGGSEENTLPLLVPHQPTRFARIRLTPGDPSVSGSAASDSLFTIEASIALLNLKAEPIPGGGVLLTWQTNPGPDDLAGYRIERAAGGEDWSVLVPLTRDTSHSDPEGRHGSRYRLSGVNGLGQELVLGETGLSPVSALAAWPLPYRGGEMSISFLTAGGLGGSSAPAELSLYDVNGRRLRSVASGVFEPGSWTARWDGRDDSGHAVASGIYFLRIESGGVDTRIKVAVVR